jgi:hypothetical protein
MPAVGLIAGLALTELGATAAVSGALVSAGMGATAASITTGALIGAGTGALSAAAQGGKPLKGALMGAVSGGVGAGVSDFVSGALAAPSADLIGPMQPNIGGSTALGAGLARGAGGFAGGLAGGLAGGQGFQNALKGGLIGGLSSGLAGGIGEATGLGPTGTSLLSSGLSYGLSQALAPSGSRGLVSGLQSTAPTVTRSAGGVGSGGTGATLGSGLASAPSSYAPGGSVFGSSDSDKPPSNVWNVGSLRNIGET